MAHDRQVISIPVGYAWRLVCEDGEDGIAPVEVLSHEDYNHRWATGGGR